MNLATHDRQIYNTLNRTKKNLSAETKKKKSIIPPTFIRGCMCIVSPRKQHGVPTCNAGTDVYYDTRMGFRNFFGNTYRGSRISPDWVWDTEVIVEWLAMFGWLDYGTGS